MNITLSTIYDTLEMPVVAYTPGEYSACAYANPAAHRLFFPTHLGKSMPAPEELLRFQYPHEQDAIFHPNLSPPPEGHSVTLLTEHNTSLQARVYRSDLEFPNGTYIILHIVPQEYTESTFILQSVSDIIENTICVNDIHTHEVLFVNQALASAIGSTPDKLLGRKCYYVLQQGLTAPCEACPLKTMLDGNQAPLMKSYMRKAWNSINKRWYFVRDSIVLLPSGRHIHIENATEITPKKHQEEHQQHPSSMDMLTGIPNREWGYRIMAELAASASAQTDALTLVFLDVDGLKHVNDRFGHQAGDEMLVSIVEFIRAGVRRSDVLFRWGGDEFVLLLQCDKTKAGEIINDIQKKLASYNNTGERPYKLSFSYGMEELAVTASTNFDAIITAADKRMYANKLEKKKSSFQGIVLKLNKQN